MPRGPERNVEIRLQAAELWLTGLTYREVGVRLGMSRQRAQQLIAPPRETYDAIKAKAKGCCQICTIRIEGGHLHHRNCVGRTLDDFNDEENLLYVCPSCHATEHEPNRGRKFPIAECAATPFLYALLERQATKALSEFAVECGVSPALLSEIYSGKRSPSEKLLDLMGWRRREIYEPLPPSRDAPEGHVT